MAAAADSRFAKLLAIAQTKYDNGDPSHDFAHILRVVKTCRELGEAEGADLEVLLPAALLHDVVNLPKDHPERKRASEYAAAEAKLIMRELGYAEDVLERTGRAIIEHSFSAGHKPSQIESAILQDADRLDALGAIGLLRMVTVGARLGRSFYDPADAFADERPLDDKTYTIDHFGTKLFKLADMMNTASARREAERRTIYMKDFLSQLRSEIPTEGLNVTNV
jgi:uncharacterized protein